MGVDEVEAVRLILEAVSDGGSKALTALAAEGRVANLMGILFFLTASVVSFILGVLVYRSIDDPEGSTAVLCVFSAVAFLFLGVAAANVSGFLHPEAYAIRSLLDGIRGGQ